MIVLLSLLAAAPAHALDLHLQFAGEQTRAATVRDIVKDSRTVLALADERGDPWVVDLTLVGQQDDKVTIEGTAHLVDVDDESQDQHFHLVLAMAQEGTVTLADPEGQARTLAVRATPGSDAPEVECDLLIDPTVQQLAETLQSFVDAGMEPRTGSGRFEVGEDQPRAATWVCGW
ncbi:MAG: hypothetical protein D6798_02455 [Deltaproteobacteria bacterium]|nr:MAG: hypothetical protein D6798_02455 [Deltaproteobacteria bacterium]